jgi:hypothetical protein
VCRRRIDPEDGVGRSHGGVLVNVCFVVVTYVSICHHTYTDVRIRHDTSGQVKVSNTSSLRPHTLVPKDIKYSVQPNLMLFIINRERES